jgi:hypothetical protein
MQTAPRMNAMHQIDRALRMMSSLNRTLLTQL